MKEISELLNQFKIKTSNISLYETAFTHSSYKNSSQGNYEKLEFLGDSILGCVVSELAYKTHQDMDQGSLSKLKASLVNTHALADFARSLHFEEYIRVGHSFTSKVKDSDKILEDVFEAFLGAMFFDQGFDKTRKFLISTIYSDIQRFKLEYVKDYKSQLQEAMQAESRETVSYEVISETGPSHNKCFKVRVIFDGVTIGIGEGSSKKQAEMNAAKEALDKRAS